MTTFPSSTLLSESQTSTNTAPPLVATTLLPQEDWFYQHKNKMVGPQSEAGISALLRMGYLNDQTLLCKGDAPAQSAMAYPQWTQVARNPFVGMPTLDKPIMPETVSTISAFGPPPSFIKRIMALVTDLCLLTVINMALALLIVSLALFNTSTDPMFGQLGFFGVFIISWFSSSTLYFGLSESGAYSGTLGKRIMGLKVVTETKKPVGLLRGLWRGALKTASISLLPIAFVIATSTKNKHALHDILARTRVVRAVGK